MTIIWAATDTELCLPDPHPYLKHRSPTQTCSGQRCFKYGCRCKEALNSETWILQMQIQMGSTEDLYSQHRFCKIFSESPYELAFIRAWQQEVEQS